MNVLAATVPENLKSDGYGAEPAIGMAETGIAIGAAAQVGSWKWTHVGGAVGRQGGVLIYCYYRVNSMSAVNEYQM